MIHACEQVVGAPTGHRVHLTGVRGADPGGGAHVVDRQQEAARRGSASENYVERFRQLQVRSRPRIVTAARSPLYDSHRDRTFTFASSPSHHRSLSSFQCGGGVHKLTFNRTSHSWRCSAKRMRIFAPSSTPLQRIFGPRTPLCRLLQQKGWGAPSTSPASRVCQSTRSLARSAR
jgi:hypothetical protein